MTVSVYARVYVALVGATLLTVGAAAVDLGPLNLVAALGIASFKALLVAIYFMHARLGRLTWLYLGAGFFWVGLLIVLALTDYATREWLG